MGALPTVLGGPEVWCSGLGVPGAIRVVPAVLGVIRAVLGAV